MLAHAVGEIHDGGPPLTFERHITSPSIMIKAAEWER